MKRYGHKLRSHNRHLIHKFLDEREKLSNLKVQSCSGVTKNYERTGWTKKWHIFEGQLNCL